MKYIQLNNTELNISPICLGTAGFGDKSDLEKSFEILNAFVWAGGNFIDTANVYCKWLKGHGNCSSHPGPCGYLLCSLCCGPDPQRNSARPSLPQ